MGDPAPPTLSSPEAFELCEKGKCGEAKESKETKDTGEFTVASCEQDADHCGGKGCYCQLFKKKKNKKKATWDVVKLNEKGVDTDYDPGRYDYSCFCVAPILKFAHSEDGVTYDMHYELCDTSGACSMERHGVVPRTEPDKLVCTGKCGGKCKCTMFRIKVKKATKDDTWTEKEAEWEYMAPADKEKVPKDEYYYRCFCVK